MCVNMGECFVLSQADVLRLVNIEHSVQGLKNLLQPGRVRNHNNFIHSTTQLDELLLMMSTPVCLGVCKRGNPDEGQQEVQTATSPILGMSCYLLVVCAKAFTSLCYFSPQ